MVMMSSEISQLTAQSQAMGMSQMQHAAMISQQAGGGAGPGSTVGENVAGMAINRIGAVASPVIGGAMALGGLDPMSMAMKGGMAGFARGGIMGAMGGGMLAGGAVALPMMAAQYAGGQMLTGVQQQQQLNTMMRQSFNFQNRYGGQGFTAPELSTIGQQFRGMSMQRGPGGETTSFEELSRLASNMGRMGMAQNVRSVEEFQDQFSKMLKQVKKVATAMSTSLEEAQEMMTGMKNVGVFRNQGEVAGDIRGVALAGNMATSEVMRAMGTGSRISRMIGGRGREGAMAGLQAAGMVGIGQQIGTLSEEDIYNVTGMTGAEGRHAMAAGMMQSSAAFLKSSLGRRVLASVAGKGGTIDAESMEEYMYGGVGTGRTMQMAHRNLAKIGRADFIRNEGRLRGAALGANPLIGIQAMAGWLEQRGMSVDDDRTRIFMQRRMKGTSMEQIDQMLKMVRDLPRMQRQQAISGERAEFGSRVQAEKQRQGIKGLKRKFEQARDEVQGTLRQVGADFYTDMSEHIERFVNKLTGEVAQQVAQDLPELTRDVLKGGAIGEGAMQRIGMGKRPDWMGQDIESWLPMQQMRGGGNISMRSALYRSGDLKRMSKAGYGITASSDAGVAAQMRENRNLSKLFTTGGQMSDEESAMFKQIGSEMKDDLLTAASTGRLQGQGKKLMQSVVSRMQDAPLGSRRRQLAEDLVRKLNSGDPEDLRLVALATGQIMKHGGMAEEARQFGGVPELQSIFGRGGFATEGEQAEAIGQAVGGSLGMGTQERAAEARKTAGTVGDIAGGVAKYIPGLGVLETGAELLRGRGLVEGAAEDIALGEAAKGVGTGKGVPGLGVMSKGSKDELGRIMMGDEYLQNARTALFANKDTQREMINKIKRKNYQMLQKTDGGKNMTDVQRAEFEAGRTIVAGNKLSKILQEEGMTLGDLKTGTSARHKAARERLRVEAGTDTWQEAADLGGGMIGSVLEAQKRERGQVFQRLGERAARESVSAGQTGFVTVGEGGADVLTSEVREQLQKGGAGEAGVEAAEAIAASMSELSGLTGAGDETEQGMMKRGREQHRKAMDKIATMSVAQKRAFAKTLRGRGGTEAYRAAAMGQASLQEKLGRAKGAEAQAAAVAQQLGVNIKAEDLKGMTTDQAVQTMIERLNVKGKDADDLRENLRSTLGKAKEGKLGEAAAGIYEGAAAGVLQRREIQQQDEQAEKQSPQFRALKGLKTSIDSLPEKIASAITGKPIKVTGTVNTVESGGKKDEKKGTP